jgi:DNA repair exonuclease SbcCD nuclease subunit
MTKFKRKRRQTSKKADAILCADIHIRADTPQCRTDDFFQAMAKKIDFILDLSKEHNAPVLVAGDLGQKPQWPNWLLEWFINKLSPVVNRPGLNTNWICICGQHDLPNHQISQFEKSGMGVLTAAEIIETIGISYTKDKIFINHFDTIMPAEKYNFHITPFPYGSKMKSLGWEREYEKPNKPMIAITHQMVIENRKLWPGQEAPEGHSLLKKFPEYNLILSGDNHLPFVAAHDDRVLVNPGSLMRTTASQENHRPRVYLWYAQENSVEPVYLPIEKNVISREHIDIAEERSDRMDAYLERLKNDVEIQLSFENNIENYFQKNRTQLPIKQKVFAAMEG